MTDEKKPAVFEPQYVDGLPALISEAMTVGAALILYALDQFNQALEKHPNGILLDAVRECVDPEIWLKSVRPFGFPTATAQLLKLDLPEEES